MCDNEHMAKPLLWFGIVVLAFGAIAALEIQHFSIGVFDQSSLPTAQLSPVTLDGVQLYVTIADTPAKQAQGLSGTASLPQDDGMLFVFPVEGKYAFWMKDMNYSLDILWLDSSGRVVYIAPDLSPSTYPNNYAPNTPARFVLEVNAGFVAQHNVQVGDIVHFQ